MRFFAFFCVILLIKDEGGYAVEKIICGMFSDSLVN